ncbi:DEAD/DEAH box helicase [Algiphilus aromaticivorans]|jgi:ATP-dependent RNA helicase RhlE|uniref:DEAD/DEAH box helicase n=1 Tax=Algiphilus aromaticivorans TaxID=382454 RepID=UPI000694AEB9|nr:DEAD/DEAH box helicase [Algiphilus aromaticivorans]
MPFSSLGLGAAIARNCAEAGFTSPTPVQAQAIPEVLSGRDLIASAQTGTGKTAAFLLPLLHRLATEAPEKGPRTPRALILAPTRELAGQILAEARASGNGLNVRSLAVFGGVSARPQAQALSRGVDLLVATPGRLLDLQNQRSVDLSRVRHVVLDEADRMLDMGFIRDLKRILQLLPSPRQTLLFSATFPEAVRSLADSFLKEPARVSVAPEVSTAEGIDQHMIRLPRAHKRAMLAWLIGNHPEWNRVLVFARTKHGADRIARQLTTDGVPAAALHGGKTQGARTRLLQAFRDGGTRVLVATDVAGRGIDVPMLPCVINFDLPEVSEDYVHRIGRTARAGASGIAIALVANEEGGLLKGVERHIGRSLPAFDTTGFSAPSAAQSAAQRSDEAGDRTSRKPQGGKPAPRKAGGGQSAGGRGAGNEAGRKAAAKRRGRGGGKPAGAQAQRKQR